jgi:hypothetical protein
VAWLFFCSVERSVVPAVSIGYGKRIGDRASFSLGASLSSGESSAGAGVGFDLSRASTRQCETAQVTAPFSHACTR